MLTRFLIGAAISVCVAASSVAAQETKSSDAPPTVRIVTEEVRLNVTAQNDYGHFDPSVTARDLLVVEDGVPQQIESVRRVRASVFVLLDTGGALNFVKNLKTTGETAQNVVGQLASDDAVAVAAYGTRFQTLADWTIGANAALRTLKQGLPSGGANSRLAAAIHEAAIKFQTRPPENRHLVLITDGLESLADAAARRAALDELAAENVTVHVISYAALESRAADRAAAGIKAGKIKGLTILAAGILFPDIATARHRERVDRQDRNQGALTNTEIRNRLSKTELGAGSPQDESANNTPSVQEDSQDIFTVSTDAERIKIIRGRAADWQIAEAELKTLAAETGGAFVAPEDVAAIEQSGGEIAGQIDSSYVINYTPRRPLADSQPGETRQIKVVSRRVGLLVNSRQRILTPK